MAEDAGEKPLERDSRAAQTDEELDIPGATLVEEEEAHGDDGDDEGEEAGDGDEGKGQPSHTMSISGADREDTLDDDSIFKSEFGSVTGLPFARKRRSSGSISSVNVDTNIPTM